MSAIHRSFRRRSTQQQQLLQETSSHQQWNSPSIGGGGVLPAEETFIQYGGAIAASHANPTSSALAERLQELLVLELHRDGSRRYLNLTVRGLYRYVLSAITDTSKPAQPQAHLHPLHHHPSKEEEDHAAESNSNSGTGTTKEAQDPQHAVRPVLDSLRNTRASVRLPSSSSSGLPLDLNNDAAAGINHQPAEQPPSHPLPTAAAVTYRERLGGYLHPRDMRRLVTPFSTSNEPELIVRRHVMLLNFDPLRAIILRDRLLTLVPDGADSLLVLLEQRVRGGSDEMENSIFGAADEDDNDDKLNETTHSTNSKKQHHSGATSKIPNVLSKILHKAHSSLAGSSSHKQHEGGSSGKHDAGGVDHKNPKDSNTGSDSGDTEIINNNDFDEWDELQGREWINLPFELQCADAVLHVVGSILTQDTMELQSAAQTYIEQLLHAHSLTDDPLTIIRIVKDAVQLMAARVKGFAQSLTRILDEDEDMALMNLSRLLTHPERFIQPVPQSVLDEESDEPELILEANLQIAMTLTNYLDLIQGQINTAKELVDQKQDATRNRLLLANMLISVFTLCTTLASLVGSFMGMNVNNGVEDSATAFKIIVYTSVFGALGMCVFIMFVLFRTGTIPPMHMQRGVVKL